MNKIILIETEPGKCRWFCKSCGKQIDYVPETIFSRPLIESCPHCGINFDSYELCERRLKTLEETDKKIKELYGECVKDKKHTYKNIGGDKK